VQVEISMFRAQTIIEGGEEEYLLCALKFRTFGIASQKL